MARLFHDEPQFSTRFFYGLTNFFGLMRGNIERERQAFDIGLTEEQMREWMVAEYLDNRESEAGLADAQAQVDKLLAVCRRHRGTLQRFELQPSGARLVKFLACPEDEA